MPNELIIVKQLPIIEERLRTIREQIEARTNEALSLACTEDTVKQIKKVRAELGKGFRELEAQRKAVKAKVLAPYEQFEAIYKECVTDVFGPADVELKRRIDEVEISLKAEKRQEVAAYFDEYAAALGIDFVPFDNAGISVSMTASMKSLRAASKDFLDRVARDLEMIDTQEHKDEILVEYKKTLDVSRSVTTVSKRHEAIALEQRRREEMRIAKEQRVAAAEKTISAAEENAPLAPPKAAVEEEPSIDEENGNALYSTTFTVTGTIKQLKELKDFLVNGGYQYESVKS